MLCHPPRLENAVFAAFRRATHLRPWPGPRGGRLRRGQHVLSSGEPAAAATGLEVDDLIAGVDFGYRGAFVCLWLVLLRDPAGRRVVWAVDELVTRQRTLAANVQAMRNAGADLNPAGDSDPLRPPGRDPWRPAIVYCDVAGRGPNSQTGRTDERVLRDAGFIVKSRAMGVEEGVALINELVDPALDASEVHGGPRFLIDPRCAALVDAMEGYRRKPDGSIDKDGRHDHLIDALRYALVHHDRPLGKIEMRFY
jgi:hypothetical protein